LQNLNPTYDDSELRSLILRALSEGWVSANEFAPVVCSFLKQADAIRESVAKVNEAWPRRLSFEQLLGASGLAAIAGDTLLCTLLESAPICDVELERLMTSIRATLLQGDETVLDAVERGEGLSFFSAVARQCFINEYVFDLTQDETVAIERLLHSVSAALSSDAPVSPLQLVTLAAYLPLHTIDAAETLLGKGWAPALEALVAQQVREPLQEHAARASIPALTGIDDDVSVAVQRQYEENPYPRWVKEPAAGTPVRIEDDLRAKLPNAPIVRLPEDRPLDILIAGCGTGRHTIETARRYADTRMLCIDLSLASLAYAERKTREAGLSGIEFAQADILKLAGIGRSFDVIESNGVLHHLGDPFAGWDVLVGLLRPNGLMNIGLYSAAARHDVTAARAYIAAKRYGLTAQDIRTCRQELMARPDDMAFRHLIRSRDFFSTSACRDLLFHVQEHQLTIPEIAAFLAAHDLRFLGFELDIGVVQRFRQQFPEPKAALDLNCWHEFEDGSPTAFVGMYQFWAQKNA
jgi:SAM-dependent methyltransferase